MRGHSNAVKVFDLLRRLDIGSGRFRDETALLGCWGEKLFLEDRRLVMFRSEADQSGGNLS